MPNNRLETAFKWALIGLLIGYAVSLLLPSPKKPLSKDQLKKLNRQWVHDALISEATDEVKHARS